jgi:hypothetical protein
LRFEPAVLPVPAIIRAQIFISAALPAAFVRYPKLKPALAGRPGLCADFAYAA